MHVDHYVEVGRIHTLTDFDRHEAWISAVLLYEPLDLQVGSCLRVLEGVSHHLIGISTTFRRRNATLLLTKEPVDLALYCGVS